MAVPMYLLYEVGIVMSRVLLKQRLKDQQNDQDSVAESRACGTTVGSPMTVWMAGTQLGQLACIHSTRGASLLLPLPRFGETPTPAVVPRLN